MQPTSLRRRHSPSGLWSRALRHAHADWISVASSFSGRERVMPSLYFPVSLDDETTVVVSVEPVGQVPVPAVRCSTSSTACRAPSSGQAGRCWRPQRLRRRRRPPSRASRSGPAARGGRAGCTGAAELQEDPAGPRRGLRGGGRADRRLPRRRRAPLRLGGRSRSSTSVSTTGLGTSFSRSCETARRHRRPRKGPHALPHLNAAGEFLYVGRTIRGPRHGGAK